MLEAEYDFYKKNKEELLKQYLNKVVVIIGDKVVATYNNVADAITKTSAEHTLGTFLVKEIKENDPPIIFRSRVRYAK